MNPFVHDFWEGTSVCRVINLHPFSTFSSQHPPNPHALFVPTFPPFVQQVIRLPPAAEEWKCGGRQQPPFCLQPNILPRPKPAPAFARSQLARRGEQCKTYQLAVRTALVPRYFAWQLDVGSLVIPSRLSSPTLLALPAIRRLWSSLESQGTRL